MGLFLSDLLRLQTPRFLVWPPAHIDKPKCVDEASRKHAVKSKAACSHSSIIIDGIGDALCGHCGEDLTC